MNQPVYILNPGTQIITHATLGRTTGMSISPKNLAMRKPNAAGTVQTPVMGHGGDVYWVQHPGDSCPAAYCFDEFELVEQGS